MSKCKQCRCDSVIETGTASSFCATCGRVVEDGRVSAGRGVFGVQLADGRVILLGTIEDMEDGLRALREMANEPWSVSVWRTRQKAGRWVKRTVPRDAKLLH